MCNVSKIRIVEIMSKKLMVIDNHPEARGKYGVASVCANLLRIAGK